MSNIYNSPLEKLKELEDDYINLNGSNLFKNDNMDLIKNDLITVWEQLDVLIKEWQIHRF